jgi:hypothetical protein
MSSSSVLQILANLIFLAGFVAIWIRLNKPAKDDPRLSRGLQLLQSKIAILEDLSDQVERQVQQVAQLMEVKGKDLQVQIARADDEMRRIESATARSMEVARIFQDRIPVEEIADRKSTLKYIKAARMANAGATIDEIQEQVDLSRGELEIIAKVNRENLQFSNTDLPEWALQELSMNEAVPAKMEGLEKVARQASYAAKTVVESQPLMRITDRAAEPLSDLGKRFREAIDQNSPLGIEAVADEQRATILQNGPIINGVSKKPAAAAVYPKTSQANLTAPVDRMAERAADRIFGAVVKKVIFPKIENSPF